MNKIYREVKLLEIWLVLAVLFLIIEFSTPGLFFGTFFAISSFLTYFLSLLLTENFWILTVSFAVLSLLSIYLLRPLLVKRFKVNETVKPSNIESFLLKEGVVIQKIEPNKKGRVEVDTESWLARSNDKSEIEVGTVVKLEMIDGTTLVVSIKQE